MKGRYFWMGLITGVCVCLAGCGQALKPVPRNLHQLNVSSGQVYLTRTVVLHNLQRVMDNSLSGQERLASLEVVEKLGKDHLQVKQALEVTLVADDTPSQLKAEIQTLLNPGKAFRVAMPGIGDVRELSSKSFFNRHIEIASREMSVPPAQECVLLVKSK